MSDNQNYVKYALYGAAAIGLAAAVWWLSSDDMVELDYNDGFTKEKLRALLEEIQLEYTCIFCRNYNIMLRIKENDEFEDGVL